MRTLRPGLEILSDNQVECILVEARAVLAEVGVLVEEDHSREVLREAGARVDGQGRVRLGEALIERALETVPPEVRLFPRDPDGAPVILGGGAVAFVPGSAATRVLDPETGEHRSSTLEDCRDLARLTDQLEAFELQSTGVVPLDAAPGTQDWRRLEIALSHGTKPVVTGVFETQSFPIMRRMLELVRGGADELRRRPLAIFDCCPTSPLSWSELTCLVLRGCAEAGIPAELISVPMTGATGPVTLRGTLVQHAAENLSGLVLHQLVAPGAPVIWGSCAAAFDMRHGTVPLGAIESQMLQAACARVGRSLGLPTHGYLGLSDSKRADYQAGMESGMGALLAGLGGLDVVAGAGMLECVGTQSLEKLVLDHEGCRQVKRLLRGIEFHPEDAPGEVIAEGVEAGQFLNLRHTRKWFRKELVRPGKTVDRQDLGAWQAGTGSDAAHRAREEVKELRRNPPGSGFDVRLAEALATLTKS